MPDQKISQLTDGGSAQSSDQIPINRGGVNYRVNAGTLGGPGSSSTTQVLYNNAGAIAGDAGFTFDSANDIVTLGSTGKYAISTDLFITRDTANVLALRNGTNNQGFRIYNTTDAGTTNYTRGYLGFNTYSTLKYFTIGSNGAGTESANVPILLSASGTGALLLGNPPDGAVTGGDARGTNAVDLQKTRGYSYQVASGVNSFAAGTANRASGSSSVAMGESNSATGAYAVCIGVSNNGSNTSFLIGYANSSNQQYGHGFGYFNAVNGTASTGIGKNNTISNQECVALGTSNTISGAYAKAFGHSNTVTKQYATAIGVSTNPQIQYGLSLAGGMFVTEGDAQHSIGFARATTTDATQTTLQFGGAALVLPASRTWLGEVYIVSTSTNAASNAGFVRRFMIKRDNASNTSLIGTLQTIGTDIGSNGGAPPAGWAVDVVANDTTESLEVKVTGAASTTIRWHCTLKLFEMGNP